MNAVRTITLSCFLLLASVLVLDAQNDAANRPSPSATASGTIKGAAVSIKYSSPAVKGREIWGGLVPYDQVWRAGANEATTFETDKDVKVKGQTLPAGKYAFFVIPGEKTWTVIFNKVADQWGAYNYDQAQDALRVVVKPKKSSVMNERLTYEITRKGFELRWENLVAQVPVK